MRHLALLFTILLATVALAAVAKAAPAATLEAPLTVLPATASGEAEAAEEGEEGEEEAGACEPEDEEEGVCEETDEGEEEDECVLEDVSAAITSSPSKGKVRVTVRYDAFYPATFTLDYSLRGGKGSLHLGAARAQLHYAGAFHDTLTVGRKDLPRLAAARQFVVELQAVGSPGYCRERLTSAAPRRASRKHRAGGRGRSGGQARTRGS